MGRKFHSLQAGRGIAALMVVFFHAASSSRALISGDAPLLESILSYGYLGVDFFFALSGFIIYYSSQSLPGPGEFYRRRLLRVYTAYLPVAVIVALLYTAMPEAGGSWGWLASLTLLPSDQGPALSVAWTLQHEVVFYAFFGLMFFGGRLIEGLSAWAACILLALAFNVSLFGPWSIILAPVNLEFMAGVIAARAIMSGSHPRSWMLVAGAVTGLLLFVVSGANVAGRVWMGLASAFAILQVCLWEARGRIGVAPWLVFMGAASYPIYLVHYPAIALTLQAMRFLGTADWFTVFIVTASLSVAFGVAYHFALRVSRVSSHRPNSAPALA